MADFAELGLSPQLVSSLTALGFEEPTPIQEAAIPAILAGSTFSVRPPLARVKLLPSHFLLLNAGHLAKSLPTR